MRRWIFNITAVLSLLLMLATVGLWVDAQSREHLFGYQLGQQSTSISFEFGSRRAGIYVTRFTPLPQHNILPQLQTNNFTFKAVYSG